MCLCRNNKIQFPTGRVLLQLKEATRLDSCYYPELTVQVEIHLF